MEITLRDVYDQQLRTGDQVSQMRGDLGTLTARVDERLASGQLTMTDHEARLRALEVAVPDRLEVRVTALERLAWKLIGAFAAINVVAVVAEWLLTRHP
jgi:uncharacterized membrane protein